MTECIKYAIFAASTCFINEQDLVNSLTCYIVNNKLFVGNLSWDAQDQDLQDLFEAHGTVTSARVVTERETGRSRGFGFVEMATDEEAQAAIDALNETDFMGRPVSVNVARPKEA